MVMASLVVRTAAVCSLMDVAVLSTVVATCCMTTLLSTSTSRVAVVIVSEREAQASTLVAAVLTVLVVGGTNEVVSGQLDAKAVAMWGVLAACAAALRPCC